jgi:uncharacterized membrane protein YgcG
MTIVLLILVQGIVFADDYYDITSFDVQIEVSEDNVYQITETLDVQFKQPRHGIYRTIPVMYYGYSHEISDIIVYDPGAGISHPFEVSKMGPEVEIKIGDADVYVDGYQSYRIVYNYDAGDDLIEDYDEFYFNIIGTQWEALIEKATFSIEMPKGFDMEYLNITAGRAGSEDNSRVVYEVMGNTIKGHVDGLAPNEGITVALPLPQGYYEGVTKPYSMIWMYLLVIGLFAVLILAIIFRMKNYRSNMIIPVLNFYPPKGLNSAEMAYIYNEEKLGLKEVASLIVYWASKGYLRIHEEEKSGLFGKDRLSFEKLKEGDDLNNHYERVMFDGLFALGINGLVSEEDLKDVFYIELQAAKGFIRDEYRGDNEILENKYQYGIIVASFIVMVIVDLVIGIYAKVLMGVPYLIGLIPMGMVLLVIWGISMLVATKRKGMKKRSRIFSIVRYGFVFVILGQLAITFWSFASDIDFSNIKWNGLSTLIILSIVLFAATVFAIGKIKRYTPYAKNLLDNIHGFKEFLETAKLDKLEMLFKEKPEYFYDMLPYVMIFNLTKIWDQTMQSMTLQGPDWYVSNRPFNSYYMMNMMGRSMNQMVSQPKSSSSSIGGGSVGGGGGGGGGGSW